MNIFERKTVKPVLLSEGEPFDSEDFVFELKFDGVRAIAFLGDGKTFIINRRNKDISTTVYPELHDLHKQVLADCVLDGEIISLTDGKPDFFKLQRRALSSDPIKIKYAAGTEPVQFVAHDILHYDGKDLVDMPLLERKKILDKAIKENARVVISKYIEAQGKALFELAKRENLEGIVAKRKSSPYRQDTRTKDWIKIKVFKDEDFILVGFQLDSESGKIKNLWLAQQTDIGLVDKGLRGYALGRLDSDLILKHAKSLVTSAPPFQIPNALAKAMDDITWLKPSLVCIISYMHKTADGNLRAPIFKGIRID